MCGRSGQESKSRRFCRPPGFTLLEVIVLVVVLGIVAAVVVPYMASAGDLEVISAARLVATDLQYAQNVAITTQVPVTVAYNTSGEAYVLSNTSGPLIHPITKASHTVDFASQPGFSRSDIVSANFGGNAAVTFDALGTPDHAGAVTLQAGPHVYRVEVAGITGRVTVTSVGP